MKVLITESQYGTLIELIQKHQRDIEFLKKNVRYSVERDVKEHLEKNFNGKWKEAYNKLEYIFNINTEHIKNKFRSNGDLNPRLNVYITFNDDYVFTNTSYVGLPANDTSSIVKWKFFLDENGEETFYSKLNKVINKKISIHYQDKLIEKVEASLSLPRGKVWRRNN